MSNCWIVLKSLRLTTLRPLSNRFVRTKKPGLGLVFFRLNGSRCTIPLRSFD